MRENIKNVYRYDTGKRGFKKVAIFLIVLAGAMALFGVIWIRSQF